MSQTGQKPWFEISRKESSGAYRGYLNVYRHPLRISFWFFGKWRWINRPNA